MPLTIRFNSDYYVDITLSDGSRLALRLLRAGDDDGLDRAFPASLETSRSRRFVHSKAKVTLDELSCFTDIDGWNHFALGAFGVSQSGDERLIATARFVRDQRDDTVAAAALIVVDSMQRKGIGKLLLSQLISAAAERGINRLRASFLPHNQGARKLLADSPWYVTLGDLDTMTAAELEVPQQDRPADPTNGTPDAATSKIIMRVNRGEYVFSTTTLGDPIGTAARRQIQ